MDHSSSIEIHSHSSGQENFPPFVEPKDHYHFHKSSRLVPTLNQMNLNHILKYYSIKINLNIIVLSTPVSPKLSLCFEFSDSDFASFSHLFHCYIPCHSILCLIILIILDQKAMA
jgi:hypothetical protein